MLKLIESLIESKNSEVIKKLAIYSFINGSDPRITSKLSLISVLESIKDSRAKIEKEKLMRLITSLS